MNPFYSNFTKQKSDLQINKFGFIKYLLNIYIDIQNNCYIYQKITATMKPAKQKAKHLVEIFGKELAPKVVDEILNNPKNEMRGLAEALHDEYWEKVKTEIQKAKNQ